MKLIIGLGNPGTKYHNTRHNAGFMAIEYFLKDIQAINCQSSFNAQICELHFGSQKVFLVKPQTFMNLSGQAVKAIGDFYKVDYQKDLLVIHDEVDLPFAEIRETSSSSAAGHNGVQNIIDELGTKDFHRIRLGVENRADKKIPPTESFVLQNFSEEELHRLNEEVFPKVKLEIKKFIQN
ncbi:MAG: aminoacyl-tRNA hydrolase [Candidatus Doudnabacteria bacterium]|nr:aminoacyl-tRNA hydrolase [Candidatus Doudnabacteria bacterium]